MWRIADLHADLLVYAAEVEGASVYDPQVRCSIPQMQQGGVFFQVLPVFTMTEKGSSRKGWGQVEVFQGLPDLCDGAVQVIRKTTGVDELETMTGNYSITTMLSIENGSSFCEEGEPLAKGFERLERFINEGGPLFYVGLTWNTENRFGGGNLTDVGLKPDGKELLRYLSGRGAAVDLSHASDALAYDILDFVDKEGLALPVMASHSNVREMCPHKRNLPEAIIEEVFRREGIIGLNLVRTFVGKHPEHLCAHLEKFLELGGEMGVCLGADWFYDDSLPAESRRQHPDGYYFPQFADASCYPRVLECFAEELGVRDSLLRRVASENVMAFLARLSDF